MNRPIRTHLSEINLKKMGIPKEFIKKSLEDFICNSDELNNIKIYVKNYLDNINENFENNNGIFFYGSNGVGKTFLASLILKAAYKYRYSTKRCTFNEYIQEYTRVWSVKSLEQREEIEELFYHYFKSVDFLCLEEIGKELDTKLSVVVLEDLLRYREEKGLVTIICTNLHPSNFKEIYGASISSLIKGNFTPIKIVGIDNRC